MDKFLKYWFTVIGSGFIVACTYTILREDNYRRDKEKLDLIREMISTQNRVQLELDTRYIDSLKQEINKY